MLPHPPDEGLNYAALLETAADVAKGMLHLHANMVLHSDLKAGNVMLKSGGRDGRGMRAKVGDFGLSIRMVSTGAWARTRPLSFYRHGLECSI